MATPTPERIFQVKRAMLAGVPLEEIHRITAIDPWFLAQMHELVEAEREYAALADEPDEETVRAMKRLGFADAQMALLRGETEAGGA